MITNFKKTLNLKILKRFDFMLSASRLMFVVYKRDS